MGPLSGMSSQRRKLHPPVSSVVDAPSVDVVDVVPVVVPDVVPDVVVPDVDVLELEAVADVDVLAGTGFRHPPGTRTATRATRIAVCSAMVWILRPRAHPVGDGVRTLSGGIKRPLRHLHRTGRQPRALERGHQSGRNARAARTRALHQ